MSGFKTKITVFGILTVSFLVYSFMLYRMDVTEPFPANEMAQRGKALWQQKNCQACHQLYGLGGHLGPDLTNVYAKRNEAYIRAFLKVGTSVMPDFRFRDKQIDQMVEFLKYTNSTGTSSPQSFKKHLDGTISQ